jgi:hypothetical protein
MMRIEHFQKVEEPHSFLPRTSIQPVFSLHFTVNNSGKQICKTFPSYNTFAEFINMNSDPSSHATGWPASQDMGHAPALQHMRASSIYTAEVTTDETESASQPARKMRTPLPSSPIHKLQNAQLVRPANVIRIANLMNPVVDREVDMAMETDYQPEDSVPLTEAVSASISQPFKETSISNTTTPKQRLPCPRCGKSLGSSWGLQLHLDISIRS